VTFFRSEVLYTYVGSRDRVYVWEIHKYASPEKKAYFESQKRKSSDVIFRDATSRITFVSLFHKQ